MKKHILLIIGILFIGELFLFTNINKYFKELFISRELQNCENIVKLKLTEKKEVGKVIDAVLIANNFNYTQDNFLNISMFLKRFTTYKNIKFSLFDKTGKLTVGSIDIDNKIKQITKQGEMISSFMLKNGKILLFTIAPIYKNGVFKGNIASFQGLNSIVRDLKKYHYEVVVLNKNNSLNVKNSVINSEFLNALKHHNNHYFITSLPIKNFENKIIGKIFIGIPKCEIQNYIFKINNSFLISFILLTIGYFILLILSIIYISKKLKIDEIDSK